MRFSKHLAFWIFGGSLALCPLVAQGQIFVLNNGSIGEYNADGTTINTNLISGLNNNPDAIAISGSNLYVLNFGTTYIGNGSIAEYTTSGTLVNPVLMSGLQVPRALAVSGPYLAYEFALDDFIAYYGPISWCSAAFPNQVSAMAISGSELFATLSGGGQICEYALDGPMTFNDSLVSGLNRPAGIAVSGSDLFVANYGIGTIGEYTTSGATVNADLISGLSSPAGIAVCGSDLFVSEGSYPNVGWVGEYTTSGATVNADLISGISQLPTEGIAVLSVPEPMGLSLVGLGVLGLLARRWRMNVARSAAD
jgi:hypothetical protein